MQNGMLVSRHDRFLSIASGDRNGSAASTTGVAPPVTVTKTAAGEGKAEEARPVKLDICGEIEGVLFTLCSGLSVVCLAHYLYYAVLSAGVPADEE